MTISGPGEWLLAIGAFVAAVVTVVQVLNRWVVQPAGRQLREVVRDEIRSLQDKVDAIAYETQINSGKSMKDVVVANDRRLERVEGQVDTLLQIVTSQHHSDEGT